MSMRKKTNLINVVNNFKKLEILIEKRTTSKSHVIPYRGDFNSKGDTKVLLQDGFGKMLLTSFS